MNPTQEAVKVSGLVHRVFQKDKFVILTLNSGEPIRGTTELTFAKGDSVDASGYWKEHPKYGWQIDASLIQKGMPKSDAAMIKWLADTFEGVGTVKATALVKKFSTSVMQVAEHSPLMLLDVHGITQDIVNTMHNYAVSGDQKEKLLEFLGQHEVRGQRAKNALEVVDSIERLKQNPYLLLKADGIDFQTADKFAMSFDMPADSPLRIQAGLVHVLRHAARSGQHTCLPVSDWIGVASKRLSLPTEAIVPQIGSEAVLADVAVLGVAKADSAAHKPSQIDSEPMKQVEGLNGYGKTLYAALKPFYNAERDIADYIKLRAGKVLDRKVPPQSAFPGLNDLQYEALRVAMTRHVSILTGGPGTGKTFTLKAIVQAERMINPQAEIILMSPTGVAAKVMSEAVGEKATTIHLRLCNEQLEAELPAASLIVIDEMSMVDSLLKADVLRKLSGADNVRLLLVGDPDQLPSVGAGNVLQDLIESGAIPVTELMQLYRVDKDSQIAENSRSIKRGELPQAGSDTFMFAESTPEDVQRRVVAIASQLVSKHKVPLADIQIMAAMYDGEAGIDALNEQLQAVFAPGNDGIQISGDLVRRGDRVIYTKNDYALQLVNGDTGVVQFAGNMQDANGDYGLTVIVEWVDGKRSNLTGDAMYYLRLAYALSIHKAQGSGFDCLIISLPNSHKRMMYRKLLYTANSRAKTRVYLVFQQSALESAVADDKRFIRHTLLRFMLTNVYT